MVGVSASQRPYRDSMKTTFWTAALLGLCAGPAFAQLSEAAGLRASVPFEVGRYDVTLGGNVHRVSTSVGQRTPFSFDATLRIPRGSSGFWLGTRAEGAPEIDSTPVRPLLAAGFWKTFRRVTVSIGGQTHVARIGGRASTLRTVSRPDSMPRGYWRGDTLSGRDSVEFVPTGGYNYFMRQGVEGDSGEVARTTLWSDVESRIGWTIGRASMEAVVGARPRIGPYSAATWGRFGASYPINDRLSLAAFAGTDPGHAGIGLPRSMFASVALRARPWRRTAGGGTDLAPLSAFNADRELGGRYRITYLAPNAKTVEVSGDFDRWQPVAMKHTRDGVWQVSLPLTPGTYRVNVRIDGGRWLPPAGLPQAEDEFNGAVGVLVIR